MKDTSFEHLWRKALENASETPPESVWKGISSHLASEDEIEALFAHNLRNASTPPPAAVWTGIESALDQEISIENAFQANFEEAAIAPVGLWEKIEAELDEERKPVIIWFARPWIATGIAAAILLAIFLLPKGIFDNAQPVGLNSETISIDKNEINANSIEKETTKSAENSSSSFNSSEERNSSLTKTASEANFASTTNIGASSALSKVASASEGLNLQNTLNTVEDKNISTDQKESLTEKLASNFADNLDRLNNIAFSPFGNSFVLERKKLEAPYDYVAEEGDNKTNKSWLGFISGLAPFDPNIQISNFEREALVTAQNVPSSFFSYNSVIETTGVGSPTETFEIPLSQPFNDVRPGNSINLGLDYGFKLHKNIAVEFGARYNRGVSFIESNVYNYNKITGDVSSFLGTHFIQNERSAFNNTVISSSQITKNAYQFLMIPVQLGIQVPLLDKFEAGLSAGVSGDFLINNVLNDTPEGGSRLNAANSAYRMANVSALAGLSLNYDINESWQASVGGNFQQALRSGVAPSQNFSFIPRYFGINYGINYRLK